MSARILQVIVAGKPKLVNTSEQTFDYLSVKVGPSALEIKETSTHFDFSARNLTNVGTVDGRDVSADGGVLDGHVANPSNPHSVTKAQVGLGSVDNVQQLPMSYLDTDGVLTANSDVKVASQKAVKTYIDSVRVFSRIIGNVDAATTANITLEDEQTIDTYAAVAGDIILVKNQTDAKENGVYVVVAGANPWTRVTQLDNSPVGEIYNGVLVPKVLGGSANLGKAFVITSLGTGANDLHTIGVDNITWGDFTPASSLSASDGINATSFASNLIAVQVSQLVGEGIEDDGSNNFRVKLDGSSLARSGSGLKVAALGIETGMVQDDAIDKAKIAADVAGYGIRQATDGSLERNDAKSLQNDNAGSITLRQLVYIKSNGHVDLAQADALATAEGPLGFVEAATIATTASGLIVIRKGAIVPGFTGLTPGDVFMSTGTAGAITQTAPSSAGQVYRKVGVALSATEIQFDYEDAIEIL